MSRHVCFNRAAGWAALVSVLAACGVGGAGGGGVDAGVDAPNSQPTLEITCTDGALQPLMANGRQAQAIAVGDKVICTIELGNMAETARRTLHLYEWALDSSGGGRIDPSAAVPILSWDTTDVVPSRAVEQACKGAAGARNATPKPSSWCDVVCCQLPGEESPSFQNSGDCLDSRNQRGLFQCDLELEPVCCDFWPNNPPVAADGQISNYGGCGGCCKLDDGKGAAVAGKANCIREGGWLVGQAACWPEVGACGQDEVCDLGFCDHAVGETTVVSEKACDASAGTPLGRKHEGAIAVCCHDEDNGEWFGVSVGSAAAREKFNATTSSSSRPSPRATPRCDSGSSRTRPWRFARCAAARAWSVFESARPRPASAPTACSRTVTPRWRMSESPQMRAPTPAPMCAPTRTPTRTPTRA